MKYERTIYLAHLESLQREIDKLNKRAKRNGWDLLEIEVTESYWREVKRRDHFHNWKTIQQLVCDVVLTVPETTFDGWKFLASVEAINEVGNTIRSLSEEDLPDWVRTVEMSRCDHCGAHRERKKVYVVKHESGELKVVGSSCVKDFVFGHHNVQVYLAILEHIAEGWRAEVGGYEDGDPEMAGAHSRAMNGAETPHIINMGVAAIERYGWMSNSKARELLDVESTAGVVYRHMNGFLHKNEEPIKVEDAHKEKGKAVLEYLRGDDFDPDKKRLSDYEWNLSVIASGEVCTFNNAAFLLSGIAAYDRMMGQKAEDARRAEQSSSDWVGEEKKRLDLNLKVEFARDFEGTYGPRRMTKMVDDSGNVFVWWATSMFLEPGDVVEGRGTVKEHSEFRGEKQTVLTRCNFEILEGVGV